jgi:pyridoxal phosphate enzyme (YggS family)
MSSARTRPGNFAHQRANIRTMPTADSQLRDNLARVRERIDAAANRAGRSVEEITLIAVSKTHSARKILQLYEAGVCHFGENRVQERESKLAELAGLDAVWHMIGHLQKNKSARAAELFDRIDSLDNIGLAERLDRARKDFDSSKILPVLIEVKLDAEPAKTGAASSDIPQLLRAVTRMPQLDVRGLMGIPPYSDNPEDARPYFGRLRELRDNLRSDFGAESLPTLSMGMSHDFEVAIEEGATEVRLGTALFGERERA